MAVVALQLVGGREACCLPPEEVANTPIPSLKKVEPQRTARAARDWRPQTRFIHERTALPLKSAAPSSPFGPNLQAPTNLPKRGENVIADVSDQITTNYDVTNYDAERVEIWNSPDMREARTAVIEFCRRAARTSPAEGQRFLARLSKLSPEEMRLWLERFQARRKNASRGREMAGLARRLTIEHAIRRQDARRQVATNVADQRSQAAEARQKSADRQPELRQYWSQVAQAANAGWSYDPFDPVFDPSSPRGLARRVAAALSLPGDLPRSDPRNFIRGEEGVDFGEWATSRRAQPPSMPVASAAVPPVVETPAVPATNSTTGK